MADRQIKIKKAQEGQQNGRQTNYNLKKQKGHKMANRQITIKKHRKDEDMADRQMTTRNLKQTTKHTYTYLYGINE